jgi:hypothetical protein
MIERHRKRIAAMIAAVAVLWGSWIGAAAAQFDTNLWNVVQCLRTHATGPACLVCGATDVAPSCKLDTQTCGKTTDVWNANATIVVIRDRKMCGCTSPFVHGLAMPREPVIGTENAAGLPPNIWKDAWDEGLKRVQNDTSALALAVNSKEHRREGQFHIHIGRLKPEFHNTFSAERPPIPPDKVWQVAEQARVDKGIPQERFGILVVAHPKGGYIVELDPAPEDRFLMANCH